jgi:hypothetical protein
LPIRARSDSSSVAAWRKIGRKSRQRARITRS